MEIGNYIYISFKTEEDYDTMTKIAEHMIQTIEMTLGCHEILAVC